jgi:hypothetical protein
MMACGSSRHSGNRAYLSAYVTDNGDNQIRKVSAAGIMTTITGNDLPGNTGDGGPAANARIGLPRRLSTPFHK